MTASGLRLAYGVAYSTKRIAVLADVPGGVAHPVLAG